MEYALLVFAILVVNHGIAVAKKQDEWFNPVLLFSAPILVSLVVNLIYYNRQYDISDTTYFIYFLSVMAFVVGLESGKNISCKVNLISGDKAGKPSLLVLWGFTAISSVFAVIQIIKGYSSGTYGNNLIDNVRYYTSYISGNNFFAKYGIVTADALMIYYLYRVFMAKENDSRTKQKLLCSILFYMLYTATQFNRTNILYFVSVIAFFYTKRDMGRKRSKKKTIIVLAVLSGIMLFAFNYIAVRTNKANLGLYGEGWWVYYFGSQFYWFEKFSLGSNIRTYGVSSLGVLGRLLYAFGIIPEEGLASYRQMKRLYGNPVSSFVSSPFDDFGMLGLFVIFFYGLAIGWIYKNHRKNKRIWSMYYATCVYQCIIAFYAFQFGMTSQIYVFLLLYFLLWKG